MSAPSCYTYTFRLPVDIEVAFSVLADPALLDRLTPPWFRLTPIGDLPPELEAGTEISYRLRWRGLPMRWTSLITDWVPGEFFAYEQRRGPYRYFRHEHFFTPISRGTEVRDRVVFRSPGGALLDRWLARPDLERIFSFRENQVGPLLRVLQAGETGDRRARRIPCTSASSSVIERPT